MARTKLLKNKKMNDEVYSLRRKVIDIIYEAKILYPSMPRITVRITYDSDKGILGVARLNKDIIWIPERTIKMTKNSLRNVVYHELCHAIFGIGHDENCPLMSSKLDIILSKNKVEKLFLSYLDSYTCDISVLDMVS